LSRVSNGKPKGAWLTGARVRRAVVGRWVAELRARAQPPSAGAVEGELAPLVAELGRLFAVRDQEAPAIFAELARDLGRRRFERGVPLRDALRELGALERVLIDCAAAERVAAAPLIAETVGEAMAAVAVEHTRAARAAEASAHQPATLAALLAQLREGVLVADRDGVVTLAGGALGRLLHADTAGWEGRPVAELSARLGARVRGLDGQPFEPSILRALSSGRPVPPELVTVDHEGELRTCETAAFPIERDGALCGAVQLFRDRTSVLRQRAALARADRELATLRARLVRGGAREI
jgi:PAS domain-containing protein